ncbi:hypothetical protein [Methanobrevibacter sp. UBA337]|uniref:hypothetical protein n=1 Tax=Methanobrevibacter sp. UBA337 TaxID=1915480 RepID=UPI0039B99173
MNECETKIEELLEDAIEKKNKYQDKCLSLEHDNQELKILLQDNPYPHAYHIFYKLWIELSTRKLGIPLDFKDDVIVEIFDSWYDFFNISRDLLKEIPAKELTLDQTQRGIKLTFRILNEILRPCLTKWQAKYRKWYTNISMVINYEEFTPQTIQQQYPKYDELIKDLKETNESLIFCTNKFGSFLTTYSIGCE